MYKKAFELSYKNKKVEIEIQDFTGTVRNINGTEDLFSLSYISDSKDKGQSILVTEADINFYADDYFNIDELKTVGETDIKVKYYEDGALLWSGFVIPDFFSTSVDITPVVSMVATDRVGTLKEISNNSESNIPIQILASCLKQTGQDLPINLIADNNHFETPIQLERIEEIASYDVIRSFMVLFNCKITLYKNAWWIINKKLLETGFINYKSYNSNGVGGSVSPFAQPILDIDLVDRDGQREIKPTASEISLFLEFGGSRKYPDNWNFEKLNKTAKLFDSWSNHAGFEQGWRDKRILFYVYDSGYYNAWFTDEDTEKISLWYRFYWYNNKISDNILDYPNLRSEFVKVPTDTGIIEISLNGSFTTRDGNPVLIMPIIHNKTTGKYYTYNRDGEIASAGNGSLNFDLSKIDFIHNPRTSTEDGFNFGDLTHEAVDINWDIKNKFKVSDFGSDTDKLESQIIFIGGVYLQGALDLGIDIFINSVQISFNDSQVTGKGLIFKIKQGGEKFSKSRDPETILFSDKINQGVNGHFYNYKYDDTSIVDLPSEFALSSVRERADMFSKARDYYSLDGDFIVNPLAKYTCGSKSFVLIGGQNRREDAGIIVEEIVSNTLNRTDFIYTYFDDGKDKVKTIGTASGGSSSSGGGGSSPSVPQLIKVDEDGNYYSEQPFYSLGGLSAFGFSEVGDGNGGGGIINVIDNLTSTSKTDPLSANMGRYLKTLIDNIEVGEGGQVIVDWEVITGKPSTFAPSAHTHTIGDVTGLQGALDGKASLSQLDDKEDKFTKNTAFNKNFGTGLNDVARGNHTHTFESLTSKPTTLGGYGITDGATNTALTTHINKTDNPHSVTKSQVGLGNVANKDLSNVDNIQQATKTEFTSHKNLFDSMFRKVGTNIEAKLSLYSLGGLSAYGFSEEGSEGGGGIVNILPSWANYTSDKSGWALGAGLGVDLNTRKADKTWVESLLEDYVPTDTTYTAGRGLTLTGTVFSTSFDIADYATVTALDGKVDKVTGKSLISDGEITRLAGVTNQTRTSLNITNVDNTSDANKPISNATQTALDSKLATNIFNTHNNDNARHITGAERTKWDTVVTDFAGLEIGSRNYILHSIMMGGTNPTFGDDDRGRWYNISDGVRDTTLRGVFKENTQYTLWYERGDIDTGDIRFRIHYTDSTQSGDIYTNVPFITPKNKTVSYVRIAYGTSGRLEIINPTFVEGNKPMKSWTPAPEDQVSDWLTTDVNSFSFIKNKPTMLSQFIDNIGVAQHRIDFDAFKTTFDTMFRKTPTNEIEAKLSLYTLGGLSAYGFSDEGSSGGGGGIVNILSDWAIYDASKAGWALGVGLGKGLYDNKADKTDPRFTDARTPLAHTHVISDITGLQTSLNSKTNQTFSDGLNTRLTSIEGGSATTVNVSGTGDLLASVSKVGNNINFIKGNQSWGNLTGKPSTFAPSAHSHPISDITNLQTTLNSKLETSIFNTHNTDNIRHITGVERTKWNKVVTDFAGLEIGGRNLILNSLNRIGFTSNDHINYPVLNQAVSGENYRRFRRTYPEGVTDNRISTYTDELFTPEKSGYYTYSTYFRPNEFDIELRLRFNGYGAYTLCKANEWTQISVTEWIEAGVATRLGGVHGEMPPEAVQWINYNRVSVTSGNKATDWTPAHEDVEAKIALVQTNLNTHASNSVTDVKHLTDAQLAYLNDLIGWWKVDASGNLYTEKNLYSTKGVSALGLGDGSGGGDADFDRLDRWADYDSTKSGWVLSALLGVDLNNRLSNVESGSATSVSTTGTGDVIVGGSKSGNVITLTRGNQSWDNLTDKPATFTPESHTHSTSDITGGIFNIARIPTGTSGTTVALGNDSRIINGQTAFEWGDHSLAGYALNSELTAHINKDDNPHAVTKAQVGLGNVLNVASYSKTESDGKYLSLGGGAIKRTFAGWPNAINSDANNYNNQRIFGVSTNNNTLSFFGDGDYNARRFGIQSGHENPQHASAFGILELNPFGGVVRINGTEAATVNSNVASATKLQTARTIAGVSFDGTENIAIPFANLASKPTTLGGYGITDGASLSAFNSHVENKANPHNVTTSQIGAVDLTTNQSIDGIKTFNANIILGVNRYIRGTDDVGGVWNVDNLLWRFGSRVTGSVTNIRSEKVGIGTDSPTEKLDVIGNIKASGTLKSKEIEVDTNWKVLKSGNELEFRYNNVKKATLTPNGDLIVAGGMTAYQ